MANNGLFRDGKQSMYEGGLRVPACMSWPNKIKKGGISETTWMTMDLFHTILDIAGIRDNSISPGYSMYNEITGRTNNRVEAREMYFTRREGGLNFNGECSYALRWGDWKLVRNNPGLPMELYHLKTDPYEKVNVIMENPDVFATLNNRLMKHIQKAGKVPWQKP
jgi:arylsulfatase A-like enzyme